MSHIKAMLFSGLCCIANAQAGTMGDVNTPTGAVYVSAEGGWTWNKLKGVTLNIARFGTLRTADDVNRGTGRVSMGLKKGIGHGFDALGEIGYGYYGKTTYNFEALPLSPQIQVADIENIVNNAAQLKTTIDGFDVLAGFSYRVYVVDLSFKAGAMIENARYKTNLNLEAINFPIKVDVDSHTTQVLPEIKLGIGYQIIDNLSLTASWLSVFGATPGINVDLGFNITDFFENPLAAGIKIQNPTINTFLLGATYSFPV